MILNIHSKYMVAYLFIFLTLLWLLHQGIDGTRTIDAAIAITATSDAILWETETTSLLFVPSLVTLRCGYVSRSSEDEDRSNDIVRCELRGPSNRWYSVGFGGQFMPGTYGIVVDVNGNVFEEILGTYTRGVPIPKMVSILSNKVKKGVRTVTFERKAVCDDGRYSFPSKSGSSIITIAAEGPIGSYYKNSAHVTRSDYGADAPQIITKSTH